MMEMVKEELIQITNSRWYDTEFNESALPPVRKYTVKQRKTTLEE